MQVSMGYPEPRANSSLPRLKLVLNGISRAKLPSAVNKRPRLPITASILHRMFTVLSTRPVSYDRTMLWAACSLCFFGFFRAGEITIPSKSAFDQARHLAWEDVRVDDRAKPSMLCIHLKVSKCDQFGKGVDVFVGRTGRKLCPVASCLAYMACRGPTTGPFFRFQDGTPLTKGLFISKVRDLLSQASLDPSLYAGHSFRIGAATSAALAGLEDSTIRALGRWSSSAFLVYIRTPKAHLAGLSCSLLSQAH